MVRAIVLHFDYYLIIFIIYAPSRSAISFLGKFVCSGGRIVSAVL